MGETTEFNTEQWISLWRKQRLIPLCGGQMSSTLRATYISLYKTIRKVTRTCLINELLTFSETVLLNSGALAKTMGGCTKQGLTYKI